ncbi:hypothetical protein D0U04_25500 [Bacillus clarus]|uniref:Uncharacterized protein n=1 Tax=Bacillus clarus TaxID=2338372 RepID=A0A090ZJ75_9BACI|nr:hypothetical protein [Bacillus clarus]KFN04271.1 hypothetical protein DJ93_5274 [Bacillus clarus]RFT63270.1 hypothetical protein D0U04_25500 [Bacillus clarus]
MVVMKNIDKIIVDGKELSIIEARTLNYIEQTATADGFIIRTHERIKKYYDALWSREQILVEVHYGDGSLNFKLTNVIGVKDGTNGQYEYHFFGV